MITEPLNQDGFRKMLSSRTFRRGEPARNRLLLAFQCLMGPRISEALNLRVIDVFDYSGRIREHVIFRKTKNGGDRRIELPAELHPFLLAWAERMRELGVFCRTYPLFSKADGRAVSRFSAYRMYRSAAAESRLAGVGTHSARKAWASATFDFWTAAMRGGENVDPLGMTAKLGGWRNIDSCSRYIGLERSDMNRSQGHVAGYLLGR